MNEFDFIRRYLVQQNQDADVLKSIGDDAAIIRASVDMDWHISKDLLLSGRHFFEDVHPADLAHKVLAVNLSDMAAMGAKPRWCLLGVALPELNQTWLDAFCGALFGVAKRFDVQIIGGDTTRGNGVFSVTILGETPKGKALHRNGAKEGDDIWVSGQVGDAAVGLRLLGVAKQLPEYADFAESLRLLPEEVVQQCLAAQLRPEPRVVLGQSLLNVAHAALDVSDGLIQDLQHILTASQVGAEIHLEQIPSNRVFKKVFSPAQWQQCVLAGGEDYELLFTAAKEKRMQIELLARENNIMLTRIGQVGGEGLRILDAEGRALEIKQGGFDHFA